MYVLHQTTILFDIVNSNRYRVQIDQNDESRIDRYAK